MYSSKALGDNRWRWFFFYARNFSFVGLWLVKHFCFLVFIGWKNQQGSHQNWSRTFIPYVSNCMTWYLTLKIIMLDKGADSIIYAALKSFAQIKFCFNFLFLYILASKKQNPNNRIKLLSWVRFIKISALYASDFIL